MLFSGVHKVRKAAAQVQASVGDSMSKNHQELNMVIFQEKCLAEQMQKTLIMKKEVQNSWVKWAENEDCAPVRSVFLKMADLDEMWQKCQLEYIKQYDMYRKHFKHILKGDRMIGELQKQTQEKVVKAAKLQKQVEGAYNKKKSGVNTPDKKLETMETELAKAVSIAEASKKELESRSANHAAFKFHQAREGWKDLLNAQKELNDNMQMISDARRNVLDLFTLHHFTQITPQIMAQAEVESTVIVSSVADKIGFKAAHVTEERKEDPENAKPDRTTVEGEPGGHEMVYDSTYIGIPNMAEDSSSEESSPALSREGSNKSASSRPLPPLPPEAGDSNPNFASSEPGPRPPPPPRRTNKRPSSSEVQSGTGSRSNTYDNNLGKPGNPAENVYFVMKDDEAVPTPYEYVAMALDDKASTQNENTYEATDTDDTYEVT